ncbi:MAG: hypothetical protein HYV96_04045 [Opitutae bacterium]|nr:hypothetical protein [Opitutae bacterium]
MNDDATVSAATDGARADTGHALLGAFTQTLALLRWLIAGLVALYLGSGLTRVAPHEVALVYRLGALQPGVRAPGLVFALPAPFDRVVKIPVRTQQELALHAWSPEEEAAPTKPGATLKGLHPVFDGYTLTGDANLVRGRFSLRYRIADPLASAKAATTETAALLLEAAALDAATQTLATMAIDHALGPGLEAFRQRVREEIQRRSDRLGLGVELLSFDVTQLTPPTAAAAAFAEVTSAQVEARTLVENARTERAQTLPLAQSEAYRRRHEADADAQRLAARAQAEAASFVALLPAYRDAPALVVEHLRADALRDVLARVKTRAVLPAGDRLTLRLPENP